jgi:PAS domain S-box-containing protein
MKRGNKSKSGERRGGYLSRLMGMLARSRHDGASTADASQAIAKSEIFLRDAIESISVGFVIYDAEDRFVLCNEAYRRLYPENASVMVPGTRYEDIMRSALAAGRYPDAKGREEEWLAQWMLKHRQSDASVESQLKDGRWVLVSERRMANGGIAGLRIDITALKAFQASLSESQSQLNQAQQVSNTGSIVWDFRTNTARWSEQMHAILGIASDASAQTVEALLNSVHPDDRDAVATSIADGKSGIDVPPLQFRVIRPDGTIRWIQNVSATISDGDGTTLRWIGTFQDITNKHKAQERQKRQEEQLQKMAAELRRGKEHLLRAQRITQTGSVVRDLRTPDTIEFSEEMYRLLGLDPSKPLPSRDEFLALFHPEDRPKFIHLTKLAAQGLATEPFDCRVIRADGTMRWLHNISETVFDEQGKAVTRIGTFNDVTEKHAAEMRQKELERSLRMAKDAAETANRAVQAANEGLERRVEERTRELHAAQEELLKSERLSALGQLTATVAHELRNPLSAIRNTTYAIREAAGSDRLQFERPLTRIERSIMRCENLVSDLLDFTRPKEPNKKPLKLDTWLGEVLDDQKMPDGISLERRFAAPAALAAIDADQFRRVVINLIENAAQAISGSDGGIGERRITVTTNAADFIEILVEDTGPGIPADVLPKVFDPLFSTKSFGTGLGLPTVKQIVEQHDGTISITSEPGRGARVRICLPAARAKVAVA